MRRAGPDRRDRGAAPARHARAMAWLAFAACWLAISPAQARHACPDTGVVVMVAGQAEADEVCQASRLAGGFLASVGLALPDEVKVYLLARLPPGVADAEELGRYDGRTRAVQVLDYRAAQAQARHTVPGMGVAMDRALWRSYIVHELAHAAIHAGCDKHCPDRASHEYVAAVTQIATLPDPVRRRVLGHHGEVAAFERPEEISEIYYALSPCRFAVKAYRHYLRPEHGPAFLRRLLAQPGKAESPAR